MRNDEAVRSHFVAGLDVRGTGEGELDEVFAPGLRADGGERVRDAERAMRHVVRTWRAGPHRPAGATGRAIRRSQIRLDGEQRQLPVPDIEGPQPDASVAGEQLEHRPRPLPIEPRAHLVECDSRSLGGLGIPEPLIDGMQRHRDASQPVVEPRIGLQLDRGHRLPRHPHRGVAEPLVTEVRLGLEQPEHHPGSAVVERPIRRLRGQQPLRGPSRQLLHSFHRSHEVNSAEPVRRRTSRS